MSKIALTPNASGTGTLTIAAPNTSTDRTLTLPDETGTVLSSASDITSQAMNGPVFSVHLTTSTNVSHGVATKIPFETEQFDTASCFDSSTNYRFTPNIAGYYQMNAGVRCGFSGTNEWWLGLYKNGGAYQRASNWIGLTASHIFGTLSSIVYLNGSTDYVELYFFQYSGSTQTIVGNGSGLITYWNGSLIRAA